MGARNHLAMQARTDRTATRTDRTATRTGRTATRTDRTATRTDPLEGHAGPTNLRPPANPGPPAEIPADPMALALARAAPHGAVMSRYELKRTPASGRQFSARPSPSRFR
jgi:hypothetical protein